jgi:hypothetical protein
VVVTTTCGNLLSLTGLSEQPPIESMAIMQQALHPKKLGEKKFLMWVVKEFILTNQSMWMFFLESMQQKGESRLSCQAQRLRTILSKS